MVGSPIAFMAVCRIINDLCSTTDLEFKKDLQQEFHLTVTARISLSIVNTGNEVPETGRLWWAGTFAGIN